MFPKCDKIAFGPLCRVTGSLLPELGEGEDAGDAIAPKTIAVHIFSELKQIAAQGCEIHVLQSIEN